MTKGRVACGRSQLEMLLEMCQEITESLVLRTKHFNCDTIDKTVSPLLGTMPALDRISLEMTFG